MSTSNIFGFEETEKMGLRKGVVFYFNDWIDEKIISILEEIIEQFLSLTQAQFTKKYNGENSAYVNRRNIRGGWKKIFHREFDNKSFDSSNILILDNCTSQNLQTVYACVKPSNYKAPSIDYFVYSYLYFQCPLDIDWSTIYQFMEYVNSKLTIHYASAGYEMAFNDLCPKSAGYGVRALKQLNYVNSEYTEWRELCLSTRFGVPCPNFIQILWPELTQKIESEIPNELHGKLVNANLFLDILDRKSGKMPEPTLEQIETRYQKLYWLLKPILVSPERPMFMKKEDWEKRLRRFEEKQS